MASKLSVRALQLLCLIATLLHLAVLQWNWVHVLLGFFTYAVFLVIGVAMGLHRGLSHRLIAADSGLAWVTLGFGTLATLGRPIEWALIHRMHHQVSDLKDDPHSPSEQGFWRVFLNLWRLPPGSSSPKLSLVRDLLTSRSVRFYQRWYYQFIAGYVVLVSLLFGISGLVFGYCLPVVLCVLATSLVNSVCHLGGEAGDSFWVTVFTFGEGIHGRHHREPKTVDLSYGVYFDLSGWLLAKWSLTR